MSYKGNKYFFEDDNRLIGGNSDNGVLANVNDNWPDNHNDNLAFRLLIVSPYFFDLIQPPSILPISIRWETSS